MQYVGPGEVHALPLGVAAERSVHYFWDYWSERLVALSQMDFFLLLFLDQSVHY